MSQQRLTADAKYNNTAPPHEIADREELAMETWWVTASQAGAAPIWPSVTQKRTTLSGGITLFRVSGMCFVGGGR